MTTMPTMPALALKLVRLPGEAGPILRCTGEISVATVEALRRELALLASLGHSVMTVNLSSCSYLDVEGIMTLLQTFKQLHQEGRRMVLVATPKRVGRMLQVMGIDWLIPVFPSEQVAARALRGGGPPAPAPATWEAARARTVARWRAIQKALGRGPQAEVLRQLTSMTALCDRAERIFESHPEPATARCEFCPLFYALGGQAAEVGCRSVIDPMIAAVREGSPEQARAQVEALIHTLEEMTLPEGDDLPVPRELIAAVRATGQKLSGDRKADRIDLSSDGPVESTR